MSLFHDPNGLFYQHAPMSGPKYKGPGLFSMGNARDRASSEMGAYGISAAPGNPYADFAAQSRGPGFEAQQAALGMYRNAAMGESPSVAQMQTQQTIGDLQRAQMAASDGLRGGNRAAGLSRAAGMTAGAQAQAAQAGGLGRLSELGQSQQAYAGLGSQLVNQGLQYDELATQQQMQGAQDQMRMYLGQRGLDQQQRDINRGFALNIAQGVVGAAGGMAQAGSTIGSSMQFNPDGSRKY